MSRKKKLYLFVTFVVLCICFSLFGCRKMIQNKQNNEMSNEYSQNQADTSQDKKNGDVQISLQDTEREDQINIEGALAYGNVIELIEDGCILQKGMENNDEYAMPIGREEQNKEDNEQHIIYDSNIQVFIKYYENDSYEKATLNDIKKNTFIYVFGESEYNSIIADRIVILRTA